MPETNTIFAANTTGLTHLALDLNGAGRRASDAAWHALRRWGQEYLRRVRQATPVAQDGGALRASWRVVEERGSSRMTAELGTSLRDQGGRPSPLHLEFGTARIAGGRVEHPRPGGLLRGVGGDDRGGVELPASLSSRGSAPAQSPILRPIGEAIAPRVAAEVQLAVANELSSSLDGKHY